MARATTVAKVDYRGRVIIPEAVREKLGIDDIEQGEKRILEIDIEYDEN